MLSVFTCENCKSKYNKYNQKPLNLPCGHVFCEDCIINNLRVYKQDEVKDNFKSSNGQLKREEIDIVCPKDEKQYTINLKDLVICYQIYSNLPEDNCSNTSKSERKNSKNNTNNRSFTQESNSKEEINTESKSLHDTDSNINLNSNINNLNTISNSIQIRTKLENTNNSNNNSNTKEKKTFNFNFNNKLHNINEEVIKTIKNEKKLNHKLGNKVNYNINGGKITFNSNKIDKSNKGNTNTLAFNNLSLKTSNKNIDINEDYTNINYNSNKIIFSNKLQSPSKLILMNKDYKNFDISKNLNELIEETETAEKESPHSKIIENKEEDSMIANLNNNKFKCKRHLKENIIAYCSYHNEFPCAECKDNHNNSNCSILDFNIEESELFSFINEIKSTVISEEKKLEEDSSFQHNKEEFVSQYYNKQINTINNQMEHLIDQIEKKKHKIIDMVKFSLSEHSKNFDNHMNRNKEKAVKISSIHSKVQYLQELINNNNYEDYFNLSLNLKKEFNEYKEISELGNKSFKFNLVPENPYPYFILNCNLEEIGQVKYFMSYNELLEKVNDLDNYFSSSNSNCNSISNLNDHVKNMYKEKNKESLFNNNNISYNNKCSKVKSINIQDTCYNNFNKNENKEQMTNRSQTPAPKKRFSERNNKLNINNTSNKDNTSATNNYKKYKISSNNFNNLSNYTNNRVFNNSSSNNTFNQYQNKSQNSNSINQSITNNNLSKFRNSIDDKRTTSNNLSNKEATNLTNITNNTNIFNISACSIGNKNDNSKLSINVFQENLLNDKRKLEMYKAESTSSITNSTSNNNNNIPPIDNYKSTSIMPKKYIDLNVISDNSKKQISMINPQLDKISSSPIEVKSNYFDFNPQKKNRNSRAQNNKIKNNLFSSSKENSQTQHSINTRNQGINNFSSVISAGALTAEKDSGIFNSMFDKEKAILSNMNYKENTGTNNMSNINNTFELNNINKKNLAIINKESQDVCGLEQEHNYNNSNNNNSSNNANESKKIFKQKISPSFQKKKYLNKKLIGSQPQSYRENHGDENKNISHINTSGFKNILTSFPLLNKKNINGVNGSNIGHIISSSKIIKTSESKPAIANESEKERAVNLTTSNNVNQTYHQQSNSSYNNYFNENINNNNCLYTQNKVIKLNKDQNVSMQLANSNSAYSSNPNSNNNSNAFAHANNAYKQNNKLYFNHNQQFSSQPSNYNKKVCKSTSKEKVQIISGAIIGDENQASKVRNNNMFDEITEDNEEDNYYDINHKNKENKGNKSEHSNRRSSSNKKTTITQYSNYTKNIMNIPINKDINMLSDINYKEKKEENNNNESVYTSYNILNTNTNNTNETFDKQVINKNILINKLQNQNNNNNSSDKSKISINFLRSNSNQSNFNKIMQKEISNLNNNNQNNNNDAVNSNIPHSLGINYTCENQSSNNSHSHISNNILKTNNSKKSTSNNILNNNLNKNKKDKNNFRTDDKESGRTNKVFNTNLISKDNKTSISQITRNDNEKKLNKDIKAALAKK